MINLIEECNVTSVNLAIELERATITYQPLDSGSLYVHEDGWFPFWVVLRESAGLINLTTYIGFRDTSTTLERLNLANTINRYAYGLTSWVEDDLLKMEHTINYRNGVLRETFIRVTRNFAAVVTKSLKQYDPDHKLLVPLGEVSAENDDNARRA